MRNKRDIIWIITTLSCLDLVIISDGADLVFPKEFQFGAATSSYQIEGGWNASGKGENIWDRLTHTQPQLIAGHINGDINCDSYHLWKKDLEQLIYLGVDHYRFSISWARILPNGFTSNINENGIRYYNNIINGLLKNNIKPIVTLYHWDLPQTLQDLGGWTNPLLSEYFADYARVVFDLFGDRVKTWITINEPYSLCWDVYEFHNGAPNVSSPGIGLYLCGKTVLLAHAKAYRIYDKLFRIPQNGKIGITLNTNWDEPKSNKSEDIEAAERELQMNFGWFANPIFSKSGDYPSLMKSRIASNSKAEGFPRSRLPELTREEVALIRGTSDFLGLNHYSTVLISNREYNISAPVSFAKDKGTQASVDPKWKPSPEIVPWGLRKLLNYIKDNYGNPLVIITENGYADQGGIEDHNRVIYLKEYMKAVHLAIEDGCNLKGYTVWSLMDNMEWRRGYTVKFGLFNVDFNDPNRTRTPKLSALFYRYVLKTRRIPGK